MAFILNIDSSAKNCSIAIQEDTKVLVSYDSFQEKSASSLINLLIERAITDCGISLNRLDAVSVGIGPGSYTGLRIAVSTAKGLALGIDCPLLAVNTLKALANSAIITAKSLNALLCPLIDARRMEVFYAIYDQCLNDIKPTDSKILTPESFHEYLGQNIIFLGDGSPKFKSILTNGNAIFIDTLVPSAKYMTDISFSLYNNKVFEDVAYLEPFYLKQFISNAKNF